MELCKQATDLGSTSGVSPPARVATTPPRAPIERRAHSIAERGDAFRISRTTIHRAAGLRSAGMTTFYKWLMAQVRRNGPVGDLARDAADDSDFPRRAGRAGVIKHLRSCRACVGAIRAAHKACDEFEALLTEVRA